MKIANRIIACVLLFVITVYSVSAPFVASADLADAFYYGADTLFKWISGTSDEPLGGWTLTDWSSALFASNKPQSYYTTPTRSVEDRNGNVTNYYDGGDTTNTNIIDASTHTFNTIHNNTTNTTNQYTANNHLTNYLNNYTTYNNNHTYNTEYKSWHYDQSTQNYTYDASQTYYNTDNSQYYISIDNSTDEYYLVDIQYSPTYVTVNYNYYTTNNYGVDYGDVTNVYYFELTDGRNSSTLSADEVAGLDLGYDVVNYDIIVDDPNTLSLQHFDGNYFDSGSFNLDFYSENRSTTYVDSGEFGQAVKLPSGSAAGIEIPALPYAPGLTFDFRIYYDKINSLGVYWGDTQLLGSIPKSKYYDYLDFYTDDSTTVSLGRFCNLSCGKCEYPASSTLYSPSFDIADVGLSWSSAFKSSHTVPTLESITNWHTFASGSYGLAGSWSSLESSSQEIKQISNIRFDNSSYNSATSCTSSDYSATLTHYAKFTYSTKPLHSIPLDFSFSNYANQWISMRITVKDGKIYYFVNGDLVGSGDFTIPISDIFYIKSSGTLYLDELRVTTGDMVYTNSYTAPSQPYDTNKVLALPAEMVEDTIYVCHSVPVSVWRIGGVRPSNPSKGFFYVPLYSDYTGGQAQLFDGSNWVNVEAMVYVDGMTKTVKGYTFSPIGEAEDITDGEIDDPGSDTGCSHNWEEVESTGDNPLYRCTLCGEEYEDITGDGPPASDDSGSDSGGVLDKLGEMLDGLFSLLIEILDKILGGLIDLVTMAIGRLAQLGNLFGSFGDAMGALWSWLPSDITLVFVAGVTIIIFLAVIKIFVR